MNNPLNPLNLRNLIQATLRPMTLWTPDVEELLMATAANESNLGEYRTQVPGPARGIFQMEGEDHDDIWKNFLVYHTFLANEVRKLSPTCQTDDMINNDPYAIAMCRVHYFRVSKAIPQANDIEGIWVYYKQYYNTPMGAATHDAFIAKYNKFVLGQ